MNEIESRELYQEIKQRKKIYVEELHCPMVIEHVVRTGRVTTFLVAARISENLFWKWCRLYSETFYECYRIAKAMAQEAWEVDYEENSRNDDFDLADWKRRGQYFFKDQSKIILGIKKDSEPYDHYKQIMEQATDGDFNASEIKQLMEAVNVGTRVFEAFKLQQEVDKMKQDLSEMSQRHGNNIIPINQAS